MNKLCIQFLLLVMIEVLCGCKMTDTVTPLNIRVKGDLHAKVGREVVLEGVPFGGKAVRTFRLQGDVEILLVSSVDAYLVGRRVRIRGLLREDDSIYDPTDTEFSLIQQGGEPRPPGLPKDRPTRFRQIALENTGPSDGIISVWNGHSWEPYSNHNR